jgi:hypothetical protein
VTERNGNHLVFKRRAHRQAQGASPLGCRRGGTCMLPQTLGRFGLTPPLTSA